MAEFPIDERNAFFDAQKAAIMKMIAAKAGMFASTVEEDFSDADILATQNAGFAAIIALRAKKASIAGDG